MSTEITFPCSHDVLVKNWNQDGFQDYELTATMGKCNNCFQTIQVLTQIGAERFGVTAGYCLPCITYLIPEEPSLEVEVGFTDSKDLHIIRITPERIENYLKNSKAQKAFPEKEILALTQAVEKNKSNPDLAKSQIYKSKPHQCKDCFGYILRTNAFESLLTIRSKDNYMIACFGCGSFLGRQSGCSMLTCVDKICGIQVCAFCLNGASESKNLTHDIKTCSEKIYNKKSPPEPRQCDCKKT